MGNVPMPSRDPLAFVEARVAADRAMDPTLRTLARHMVRRIRKETPAASVLTRALQALSVQLFVKVSSMDPDALTLARSISELHRVLGRLGFRPAVTGGAGRTPRQAFPADGDGPVLDEQEDGHA